jgi:succinyl-CoA synthetase beta subunit
MKIHEYQAKALLQAFDVPTLQGISATSATDAKGAAQQLGGNKWVVKAQIHAGGRGKGGGVKIASSLDDVYTFADALLGKPLITPQTGPEGRIVRTLYIEKACAIAQELYLSLLLDRASSRLMFIASASGGMDIEEVAHKTPDKIYRLEVDPLIGYQAYMGRQIAFALGLTGKTALKTASLIEGLYKAFMQHEASLLEINPLVITQDGDPLALDAKMTFDENALFRHPEVMALRDIHEEDPAEIRASEHSLSYVKLDGNIGCMVNGAGLAMATMDAIQLYGGTPANFLDVGGGAPRERVTEAFRIILSDPNVQGILVNIFGGIMRCDIIAEGIIEAAKDVSLKVPLVVRLEGTNVALGKSLLAQSGLAIIAADDLGDAAQKIVFAVKEAAA